MVGILIQAFEEPVVPSALECMTHSTPTTLLQQEWQTISRKTHAIVHRPIQPDHCPAHTYA